MLDTNKIKERIISILNAKGPGFPSPIASEIQTSILFTSAFLSELLSEKQIKITNMKVGSSPIYYIPGQESQLESFAIKYLKSKEKEAFIKLQENKILKDTEQEPAIRVALREIRDFAIPQEKNNELYWKYFIASEEEVRIPDKNPEEKREEIQKPKETQEPKIKENPSQESKKEELDIFEKEEPKEKKDKPKKTSKKKTASKQDDKFFNMVKEYLSQNNIEIIDLVSIGKSELTFKVRKNQEEQLLVAYKKKAGEKEIIAANKKAQDLNLKYAILSTAEPLKKTINLIEALKNMSDIQKI